MLGKIFGRKKNSEKKRDLAHQAVDVAMKYCPQCGDEYRASVAMCYNCQVELLSGEEKLRQIAQQEQQRTSRSMDIGPDDQLVALRSGSLQDLKPLRILLGKENIPALLTGEQGGGG